MTPRASPACIRAACVRPLTEVRGRAHARQHGLNYLDRMDLSHSTGASDYLHAAARWFGRHPDQLGASERKVLSRALERRTLIEDPSLRVRAQTTFGER